MRSVFAAFAIGALTGCTGHGSKTSEHLADANANMARVRAATQYDLAYQQFRAGQLNEALTAADGVIELDPRVARGHLLRARVLLELDRAEAALESAGAASELDPENAEVEYVRGIAFERLSRRPDAIESHRRAAALEPESAHFTLSVAELLVDVGSLDEAIETLDDADDRGVTHPGFPQLRGHIALLQGNPDEALGWFREAVVLRPEDSILLEDLARAQITTRRFDVAELTLRRILDAEPNAHRPDLEHLRAACLIELDRPVEARTILRELAGDEDPADDFDVSRRLSDVALLMGDDALLLSSAQRMIALSPGRAEGYLSLAVWKRKQGDHEGALATIEKATGQPVPNRAAVALRRLILQDLGRSDT